jgi:hypothetical protein
MQSLPAPTVPRNRIHTRSIVLEGFQRDDGLWEIEAHLVDQKDYDMPLASGGVRRKGEPVHDMSARVTFDDRFNIVDALVAFESAPYPGSCEAILPDYRQIIGLNLVQGFRVRIAEIFAKTQGCTHLTELLMPLPSAAIQALSAERQRKRAADSSTKPFFLDQCHALSSSEDTVKQFFPRWYSRKEAGTEPT